MCDSYISKKFSDITSVDLKYLMILLSLHAHYFTFYTQMSLALDILVMLTPFWQYCPLIFGLQIAYKWPDNITSFFLDFHL